VSYYYTTYLIIEKYILNYFSDGVESPETSYKEEREYKHK
jgi:hypothetical protein